ncbi:MAG: hypothetical protein IPK52_11580 [Chloroflexi bacterium]|nr:hypothetical protein [Chloroflexota bacterium]
MDTGAINSVLGVTSQDIAYFRRGELSPAARKKQVDAEKGCARWLVYILLACAAILVGVVILGQGNWETIIAVGIFPAFIAVGALVLLYFGRKPMLDDPKYAQVHSVSGPAKLSVSVDRGSRHYIMLVAKVDFHLDKDTFDLIPEDAVLTAYYQKFERHHRLLAVGSNG